MSHIANQDDLPRSKGWFSFDRHTVVRTAIATTLAALARRYGIQTDSKLRDYTNLAVVPVFAVYEKLDDEIYKRSGYRYLSGAFGVACLSMIAASTFMELDRKDLLLYGGVCGACILIADSVGMERHAFLNKA